MARRRFGIFMRDAGEDGLGASHDHASEDSAPSGEPTGFEPPAGPAVFDRMADGDDDFTPPDSAGSAEPEPEDLPPASAWAVGFDPATPTVEQPSSIGNGVLVDDESASIDERVRAAAQHANDAAEQRATEEILALERDLESARSEAKQELEAVQALLSEAERRAAEAEQRAGEADGRIGEAEKELARLRAEQPAGEVDPERVRAEAEDRARAAAADWLRKQLDLAREEAHESLEQAVEAARAEAETRADAEIARVNERSDERLREIEQRALAAAERVAAAEEELAREAERLKERSARLDRVDIPAPNRAEALRARVTAATKAQPVPKLTAPQNGKLSLAGADLAKLRALGMSVTQAKRVLRYRDERGTIVSVDELDSVPGFPRPFLEQLKQHLEP